MFKLIFVRLIAACVISSLWAPLGAIAHDWPSKPIRLVINFAPDSSPDVLGCPVELSVQ